MKAIRAAASGQAMRAAASEQATRAAAAGQATRAAAAGQVTRAAAAGQVARAAAGGQVTRAGEAGQVTRAAAAGQVSRAAAAGRSRHNLFNIPKVASPVFKFHIIELLVIIFKKLNMLGDQCLPGIRITNKGPVPWTLSFLIFYLPSI